MSPSSLKSTLRYSFDGFAVARQAVLALALLFLLGAGVHAAVSPDAHASSQAHPPAVEAPDSADAPEMNDAVSLHTTPSVPANRA